MPATPKIGKIDCTREDDQSNVHWSLQSWQDSPPIVVYLWWMTRIHACYVIVSDWVIVEYDDVYPGEVSYFVMMITCKINHNWLCLFSK